TVDRVVEPELCVLGWVRAAAEPEVESPTARMVEGHGHLRQQSRVPEAVREHEVSEPDALRDGGQRGRRRPRLERRYRRKTRRVEMAHAPDGLPPPGTAERAPPSQLVPCEAALRQIHADLRRATRAVRSGGQCLSHADPILDGPAEPLVEADDVAVLDLDLEVDLGTAELAEALLGFPHQRTAEATTLMLRRPRDGVEPAAMAVVARHRGRDDGAVYRRDQEELALPAAAALEDRVGRAPGRIVVEHALPERGHGRGIGEGGLPGRDRPSPRPGAPPAPP